MIRNESHTDRATMDALQPAGDERAPVFILGIMPRSGTNFLHRLLCQHPECGAINTTPVREDYLMHHAGWLSRYIGRLKWQWGHWGGDADFVRPLAHGVGKGLSDFLDSLSDAPRIVTKTPSVANLSCFFDYFPHAYLLVIVRDGRSVVASGMSGFDWHFETAAREWARAARAVRTFKQQNEAYADRYCIVQYERLNENTVEELDRVLRFLKLDPAVFDFDSARETPVYGSSFSKHEADQVSWKPREKQAGFDTNARWKSWSRSRHRRFNWIAARELTALGYEPLHGTGNPIVQRFLDASYVLKRLPRRLFGAARESVRTFVEALQGNKGKVDLKR